MNTTQTLFIVHFQSWLLLLLAIGLALLAFLNIGARRRALHRWAVANRLIIHSAEIRHFERGPFLLTGGKQSQVYYISAQHLDGRMARGFVMVRPSIFRWFGTTVSVVWDKQLHAFPVIFDNPETL